mmetsp:Transcript_16472/g.49382  ORF Transcript_16472/g.49382 Transcript_16472/m.49382 type:complete len:230 (-) Transcript_16472:160-849(-)
MSLTCQHLQHLLLRHPSLPPHHHRSHPIGHRPPNLLGLPRDHLSARKSPLVLDSVTDPHRTHCLRRPLVRCPHRWRIVSPLHIVRCTESSHPSEAFECGPLPRRRFSISALSSMATSGRGSAATTCPVERPRRFSYASTSWSLRVLAMIPVTISTAATTASTTTPTSWATATATATTATTRYATRYATRAVSTSTNSVSLLHRTVVAAGAAPRNIVWCRRSKSWADAGI